MHESMCDPAEAGRGSDVEGTAANPQKVQARVVELAEQLPVGQHAALVALAGGAPFPAAAQAAGVHRATVYRWLKSDPLFRAAYNAWQEELRASARARLLKLADQAVDVLARALDGEDRKVALTLLKKLGLLKAGHAGQTDPEVVRREMELECQEQEQLLAARSARHILDKAGFSARQQKQYLHEMRRKNGANV